ncbi:hypothetical protein VTO73DRAFT_514 [Trametes versicolor]
MMSCMSCKSCGTTEGKAKEKDARDAKPCRHDHVPGDSANGASGLAVSASRSVLDASSYRSLLLPPPPPPPPPPPSSFTERIDAQDVGNMDADEAQEHKASAQSAVLPKLETTNDATLDDVALPPSMSVVGQAAKTEGPEVDLADKTVGPENGTSDAYPSAMPVPVKGESDAGPRAEVLHVTNEDVVLSDAAPEQNATDQASAASEDGSATVLEADDNGAEDSETDEDDDNDEEEEDEDLQDPSQDIKEDLAAILSGDLEFTGAFSFNKTYPTAPNPALNIDGLGTIGLPLSTRDAAAIKARSEQAPFGKVDQTIVDKTVRDTWEIDATKVHFENGAWVPFMDQAVRDVCQVLGVNFEASKPRCELYKLLLYETGSHFLPHVDTEKVNGMFATIVVILPSRFTGGAVHVRHGDLDQTYDSSEGSLTNTSVLAWYTDVEHEVKAVTGGYRLALSFNLVHTTNALRPTLSVSTLPSRLQHVLRSWKQAEGGGDAPRKIIYLLSHKYSQAALRGSALKGVDAHLVAILDTIGTQHGIHLGLANLTCTQRGGANDYGGRERDGWGRCYYDEDSEDPDDDDVSMCEVDETNVEVENLVDMDGKLIRQAVDYDLETEVIPEELVDEITAGEYDDQEYEGYQGNYGGTLERFYRRTVLVMWPAWAHFDLIHGSEGFTYACQRIRDSKSSQPTTEETELTEIILVRANATKSGAIVESVCRAALRWKDLSLWFRAIKACDAERSISALGEKHIYLAVDAFGFAEVKPCIEHALERDPSNVSTLQFLEKFETWIASQHPELVNDATKDWVSAQRTKRFNALKPLGKDEHKSLTALALKYGGGVDFLENKVLPLIKPTTGSAALLEYAMSLKGEEGIATETRARLARDLLATALAKVDFYATAPVSNAAHQHYSYAYSKPVEEPGQLERAKPYFKAFLELGTDDLFATAVDKLLALSGLVGDVVIRRVKGILLPLVAYGQEILRTLPGGNPPPALRKLSTTASLLHLQTVLADPRRLVLDDVPSLVQAVVASDKPEESLAQVVAKFEGLQVQTTILHAIIKELGAKSAQIDPSGITLNPLLLRLLQKYVNDIDLTYIAPPAYASHSYYRAAVPAAPAQKPALAALEFCLSLQLPDACKLVIGRLLNPAKLDVKYIETQLAPLLPDMRALLVKYNQPLTSEAFAMAARKIMLYWVQKVMGPRPPNSTTSLLGGLKGWTCNCDVCPPRAPKVTKTKAIVGPAKWAHGQAQGKKLLRSISAKEHELKAVLGPDYARIVAGLEGRSMGLGANVANAAATAPVASGSSTASATQPAPQGASRTTGATPAAATIGATATFGHPGPASMPNAVPTGVAATHTPSVSSAAAPSSKRVDDAEHAQRKRRKMVYDEQDVIDLT